MGNAIGASRKALALSALILAAFVAEPAFAQSCPSPDRLEAHALKRHFSQEKYLKGMSSPLRSEGVVTATEGKVVWHMTDPFDMVTTITPQGVSQSVNGEPAEPAGQGTDEIGAAIARSITALMRGQWDDLSSTFDISRSVGTDGGDWTVDLKPLDKRLEEILSSISVRGCSDVKSVVVRQADGDVQKIRFADMGNAASAGGR